MKRRIALAALLTMAALSFVGASGAQLNPLVTRRAEPAGPAPLGCDESLAPSAVPRVNVAEIPERDSIAPVSMPPAAPPSRSLREELDAAHRALVRNDRPAFDEHLRAARTIVQSYPAGGERSRAEEVLWALNDAAVLWDAQFQSPFFDETSDAYARASRYAGYAEAMRRSVLTDDRDRRFYPAAESRDFVTRVAAERLQRLGVRGASAPPPRVTRAEPPAAPPERVAPSSPRRTTTSRPSRRSRSTSIASKSSKPAAPAKSAPSSSPDPSDAAIPPAPAEPAPTAPPASASQASADAPASPVAGDVPSEPPPAPGPVPTSTDSATTTSAPAIPEPTPAVPGAVPAERRSVIVPALLILIGLGVLVVLFRASK